MDKTIISKRVLLSQVIVLVSYGVLCLFSILLLVYLRVNRHVAFSGDAQATRKVILPAFEPLLWILAAFTGAFLIFFCIALKLEIYTTSFPSLDSEIFYAGRQFVFVLGLVFLCQKSVSVPALRRAVAKTIVLASYTVPVIWMLSRFAPKNTTLLFLAKLTMRPLLLIFVAYVCFIHPPAGRASAVALRIHGVYIFMYHVMMITNIVIQQFASNSSAFSVSSYIVLAWGSFCPLVIWRLLRADTEYWRGMGERVWSLQQVDSHPGQHFQRQVNEDISSSRIHDLIEVHRKFLIDFAHLEVKRKIGEGSSASVFRGRLRQCKPVAVKVYTPLRFTEEVVAEFSYEAALCASMHHPNIVEFYGMCVCPPTIGLVFELCQGSLEDVMYAQSKTCTRRRATRNLIDIGGDIANAGRLERQQMLLDIAYMIDCARAIAYVHSFSPPLLHRDVKPANFLVDKFNNVKLTDFGDSRRLPRELPQKSSGGHGSDPQASIASSSTDSSPDTATSAPPQIKMTVTGTVSYMAPELISSRTGLATYGEAADVYSLAITFWDILFPDREKYPVLNNNPLRVLESVLNGYRPPLEDTETADPDETLFPKLREIITSSWHNDPNARPTMPQIVHELECIQEELLAGLALDLCEDFDRSGSRSSVSPSEKCFTGQFMVERMEDLEATDSRGESMRLGRALMDAGFLHHLRHSQGFEANTTMYYFDDSNINLCQPVAMLEETADTSPESDDEAYPQSQAKSQLKESRRSRLFSHLTSTFTASGQDPTRTPSSSGAMEGGVCACRMLGQCHNAYTKLGQDQYSQHRPRWHKSSSRGRSHTERLQSTCRSNSSSIISSNSGSTGSLSSQKRWKRRSKIEEGNTLTHKLLDQEQNHTIVIDGDKTPEALPLAQPAA